MEPSVSVGIFAAVVTLHQLNSPLDERLGIRVLLEERTRPSGTDHARLCRVDAKRQVHVAQLLGQPNNAVRELQKIGLKLAIRITRIRVPTIISVDPIVPNVTQTARDEEMSHIQQIFRSNGRTKRLSDVRVRVRVGRSKMSM